MPVAVGDRAAAGGDDDLGGLLGGGGLLERAGLDDAEPAGAQAGEGEQPRKTAKRRPIRRSISRTRLADRRRGRCRRCRRWWAAVAAGVTGAGGRRGLRHRRGGAAAAAGGRRPAAGAVGRGRRVVVAGTTGRDRRHQRPGHDAVVGHQLLRGVARRAHAAGGAAGVAAGRARAGSATSPAAGVTMPRLSAPARMRSPEARRAMFASMPEFWRSSGRGGLDRARDAGVELEQRDLHRDDPHQRDADEADPHAPAQEAVDDAVVGQRPDALEDAGDRRRRRRNRRAAAPPVRRRGAGAAGRARCGRARGVALRRRWRRPSVGLQLAGGAQARGLRARVLGDLAGRRRRPSGGTPARPRACARTRRPAGPAGRCSPGRGRRGSASRAGPRASGRRSRRAGRSGAAAPTRAGARRRAGRARR